MAKRVLAWVGKDEMYPYYSASKRFDPWDHPVVSVHPLMWARWERTMRAFTKMQNEMERLRSSGKA